MPQIKYDSINNIRNTRNINSSVRDLSDNHWLPYNALLVEVKIDLYFWSAQ